VTEPEGKKKAPCGANKKGKGASVCPSGSGKNGVKKGHGRPLGEKEKEKIITVNSKWVGGHPRSTTVRATQQEVVVKYLGPVKNQRGES